MSVYLLSLFPLLCLSRVYKCHARWTTRSALTDLDGERGEEGVPGPSPSLAKLSVLALGGAKPPDDTAEMGVSGRPGVLGRAETGVDAAAEVGVAGVAGVAGVTGVTGTGDLGRADVGVDTADIGVAGGLGSNTLWVTFRPYLCSECRL